MLSMCKALDLIPHPKEVMFLKLKTVYDGFLYYFPLLIKQITFIHGRLQNGEKFKLPDE